MTASNRTRKPKEAPDASADIARLRQEIERTRVELGATVEQLAAKADVAGRARAKAAGLAEQLRQSAAKRAGTAGQYWLPTAMALGASVAAFFVIRRWTRS